MEQARALPRLPAVLPNPSSAARNTTSTTSNAYKDSIIFPELSAGGLGGPSHSHHADSSSSSSTNAESSFLQPRDAPAHQRRLPPSPTPELPKLSPGWHSSSTTTSSSDTTRRSDQASWYSYPASNYPLPNPYAHSWNGSELQQQFDNDTSSPLRSRSSATESKPPPPPQQQQPQSEQQQSQYMLPIMSPTSGLTYAPAPPTFGGGLGAAFPEYLPYPYNPFSNTAGSSHTSSQPTSSEPHYQPPREVERGQVGPSEYTQALDIYRHIRAALPYIRAADAPGPTAMGQSYRSILDVASTAVGVLSGIPQKPTSTPVGAKATSRVPTGAPEPKRARVSNGGDKEKPATFCRGCGATETPEWRRGPLGPRTLCNACGLVHMKMMRKKRKAEEKAAADAAAAAGKVA